MQKDFPLRIALDVILGICLIFGLWYIAIPIGVIGAWRFRYFAELAIFAFIHDALFGFGAGHGFLGYLYISGAVVILLVMSFLKVAIRQ